MTMTINPFASLRRMSTAAAVSAALALLFALLALMEGLGNRTIQALQYEIFSLLFLHLYQHEVTKSMLRKVCRE